MSDNILPEIVLEILSRLPVKSLLQLRCVCKSWLSLIDSPDFVKFQLNRSISNKSNTCIVRRGYSFYAHSLDTDLLDLHSTIDFKHLRTIFKKYAHVEFVGSVNGVVCLLLHRVVVVLWNPSTRQHFKLPCSSGTSHEFIQSYGFGYDSLGDEFKVIRIDSTWMVNPKGSFDGAVPLNVQVFGTRSMSWTQKGLLPHSLLCSKVDGQFAGNSLHWLLNPNMIPFQRVKDHEKLILAFHLGTEEYQFIPQPDYSKQTNSISLVAFEGFLGLVCYYGLSTDIWVMKEYGLKESWTRMISVDQCLSCFSVRPVMYSKDGGRVLLEKDREQLVWYDLELKKVEDSGIEGLPQSYQGSMPYVESLIQLPCPSEVGMKRKQKIKKKEVTKQRVGPPFNRYLRSFMASRTISLS